VFNRFPLGISLSVLGMEAFLIQDEIHSHLRAAFDSATERGSFGEEGNVHSLQYRVVDDLQTIKFPKQSPEKRKHDCKRTKKARERRKEERNAEDAVVNPKRPWLCGRFDYDRGDEPSIEL